MTDWASPKIDWDTNDVIGYADLNRIESNIAFLPEVMHKKIDGIGFKTDSASSIVSVFEGSCSSINGVPINFTTTFEKALTSWAVGNGPAFGGMASAVTLATNTWYYIFVIMNPANGTTEVMFDDNVSGTNVANGTYTEKRRVGSFKTGDSAGTLAEMYGIGDTTYINPTYESRVSTLVVNSVGVNDTYQNTTLTVGPSGNLGAALPALSVRAKLNLQIFNASVGLISNHLGVFTIPPFTNAGASFPAGEYCFSNGLGFIADGAPDVDIMVDSANQIQVALYHPSDIGSVYLRVRGFFDDRLI